MIKKILIIAGIGFIIGLPLFSGTIGILEGNMGNILGLVKSMPMEIRIMFFSGMIALFWLFYDQVLT